MKLLCMAKTPSKTPADILLQIEETAQLRKALDAIESRLRRDLARAISAPVSARKTRR